MSYKMKFMSGAELTISDTTANSLINLPELKGSVKVSEIGGVINLSSVEYILPDNVAQQANANNPKQQTIIKCHDGSIAIKKFGKWVDQFSGADLDVTHYPELNQLEFKQLQDAN